MPILVTANTSEPIRQGDLIKDIDLFATQTNTENQPILYHNGKETYALIVSRDCNVENKSIVTVVAVTHARFKWIDDNNLAFDDVRRFFESTRDGGSSPDRMYLGHLPTDNMRLWARLDELYSIMLPAKELHAEWIRAHRIARLDEKFLRSLPVRLFNSVAKTGYHDQRWYADADLNCLVTYGEKCIASLKVEIANKKTSIQRSEHEGEKEKKIDKYRLELKKKEEKLRALEKEVQPFINEQKQRQC